MNTLVKEETKGRWVDYAERERRVRLRAGFWRVRWRGAVRCWCHLGHDDGGDGGGGRRYVYWDCEMYGVGFGGGRDGVDIHIGCGR